MRRHHWRRWTAAGSGAALALVLALVPRFTDALDKTANYGFETAAEPGASWTQVQTSLTATQDSFARTTAQRSEGTYSFYGNWHGTSNNRTVDKSLTQTFTPATAVYARMRASYMRTATGAVDSHAFSVKLRDGTTDVLVPVNLSAAAAGTDASFVTSSWTSDVLLTAGRTYTIEVRWAATIDTNEYQGAYVDDVQLQVSPAAPSASSIAGSKDVQLSWTASATPSGPALHGTTPYRVYRGTSSGGETALAYVATNAHTDTSTVGNTTYWYQVADVDTTNVESPRSPEGASVLTRPGAPTGVTLDGVAGTSVSFHWSAPSGGTQYYVVERADDVSGAPSGWAILNDSVPPGQLTFADSSGSSATTYWYRVSARNASGTGAPSSPISATTSANLPGTPGTPAATPSSSALELAVAWTPASGTTNGYKVWRSTNGTDFGASPVATGVSSPWTDTAANGLAGNTRYWYRAQGTNDQGDGPLSAASAAALTIPGAPSAPSATAVSYALVRVTWSPPSGPGAITGYSLYRSDNGGPFALLPGSPTSPHDDTTVSSTTTYAYRVVAVNATGTGPQSASSNSVTTPEGPPGAPAAPTATPSTTAFEVSVSWAPVGGATSYEVWRSTDGVSFGGSPIATGVASPWTDTTATGVAPNTTYWYAVQAANAHGESPLSPASAAALTIPDAPAAPGLSSVTSSSITVTWSAPGGTGAITGYRLYRSQSGGPFAALPGSPSSPYVDPTVLAATTYAYKVAALNATGEGVLSAASPSATTLPPVPGTPGPIAFSNVKSYSVRVTWTAATSATSYKVERAPDEGGAPGTFMQMAATTALYHDSLSLTAGTRYWYRVRAANSSGDGSYNTPASVTTLGTPYLYVGNGADDPTPVDLCPTSSPAPVVLDDFTLDAAVMADSVTRITVTLQPSGAWANLAKLEITNADGSSVLGGAAPGADAVTVTLSRSLAVAMGSGLHYKVRVTPKAALAMPAPRDGRSHDITATVTGVESTNVKTYGDTASGTMRVDNQSPARPVWSSLTPAADSISLAWTAPVSPDRVLVVRRESAPVLEAPAEGTAPTSGTVGTGTIVYEGAGGSAVDGPPLASGRPYHYALFVRDACNNWSAGATAGPIFVTTGAVAEGDPTPNSTRAVVSIENPSKGASVSGPFRVQVRAFSRTTAITDVQLNYAGPGGWLGTWESLVRNPAYYDASSTTLGIFERSSLLSLTAGAYTLVARASNDGGATWVNSAAVSISVNAPGQGDGNLLVRDNSNQLCTDCHAIKPHSAESATAKHGSWSTTCRDCHAPHGSKNAYLVRNEITTPSITGAAVPKQVFFADPTKGYTAVTPGTNPAQIAQAGFANQDLSGVCQACHTRTTSCPSPPCTEPDLSPIFRNSGPLNLEPTHGAVGAACTNCHSHTGGFKSPKNLCYDCHGVQTRSEYPAAAPPKDTCGNLAPDPLSTTNRVGAHAAHLTGNVLTNGFGCEQCHVYPPTRPFHDDSPPLCSDVPTDRALFTWGAITSGADSWSGPVTPSYDYVQQTCSNYCHGNFRNGNDARPTWNGTAPCGSCHGLPPVGTHVANESCGLAACHGAGYSKTGASSGTVDLARHANGVLEQYSNTCQSCHGTTDLRDPVSGTAGELDPFVRAAPPADTAGATTGNYVGPHLGHVWPDPNQTQGQIHLPYRCRECHGAAVDSYTVAHPDPRPAEIDFSAAVYAGTNGFPAAAPPGTPRTCTTYCHVASFDPTTQRGSVSTWSWNTTTVTCGSCHKAPPTDPEHTSVQGATDTAACNPCHDTTVSTTGKILFSAPGAGATTEHIDGNYDTGGISCASCHGGVSGNFAPPKALNGSTATTDRGVGAHQSHVLDGGARNAFPCTQCHPDNTAMNHANGGAPETAFGSTGTIWNRDATPPTCSSSYCHGGQTSQAAWGGVNRIPQWTTVNGTYRACNACHNAPPNLNATTHHPPNPSCWKCHGPGYSTAGLTGEALNTHVDTTVNLVRAECTLCHGDLTATNVPFDDLRAMPGYNANAADCADRTGTSDAGVGAHYAHLMGTRLKPTASLCGDCHPGLPTADDDRAHATGGGTNGARATVDWSTFVRTGSLSPSYTGSQTGSNVNTAGACSNTYCHGGKFNQAAYVANYQGSVPTPSWTGGASQAACGACHKVWPTSQAHGTVTTSTLCSVCHPGYNYSVAGGGNVNPDLHINGKLDGGGGPNCTAVECHGGTSIASRRRVTDDFANGTTPNFRSHHVGNGAQTAITAATGMSATGMGGTLTNNDCYVCHAEAIASSPGVWTTGGLHMNTTIDLRDSDTGMAYPYRKQDITGAAGTWNSSNANWVTETSTNLDPFCNSCHDVDGATGVSAFWEAGATAGNPFNDGAVTNNYDRFIRCQTPPCTAPGTVVDIASRVDDTARRVGGTYWTAQDRDVAGEERGPDGRTDPPYGVYSRHAIRGMSVSTYGGLNTTGSAWDSPTPQVGTNGTYWNRSKVAWASNSVMGCADCHTTDGANGTAGNAHGSTSEYLLKDANGAATEGAPKLGTAGCFQCHLVTKYNAGTGHTANGNDYQDYLTSLGTARISSSWPDAEGTGGNVYGHSCLSCHGGGMPSKIEPATRPGGFGTIHGTNQVLGIGLDGAAGNRRAYRFTNGNSMRYYNPSDTGTWTGGGSCYTINSARGTDADQWGGCNKHDGASFTFPGGNRPLRY